MSLMIDLLKGSGYGRVSLSVQKANYAAGMYLKLGFVIVNETEEEFVMVKNLLKSDYELRKLGEKDVYEMQELFRIILRKKQRTGFRVVTVLNVLRNLYHRIIL